MEKAVGAQSNDKASALDYSAAIKLILMMSNASIVSDANTRALLVALGFNIDKRDGWLNRRLSRFISKLPHEIFSDADVRQKVISAIAKSQTVVKPINTKPDFIRSRRETFNYV